MGYEIRVHRWLGGVPAAAFPCAHDLDEPFGPKAPQSCAHLPAREIGKKLSISATERNKKGYRGPLSSQSVTRERRINSELWDAFNSP
jgi:hypothetical protein